MKRMLCGLPVLLLFWACSTDPGELPARALTAPEIYPMTNIVGAGTEVTVVDPYSSDQLRYTMDGTLPGPEYGQLYNQSGKPLIPSNTGTVKFRVRAFKQGFRDSPVAERLYLVNPAAIPLFSPSDNSGYYSSPDPVTVSITTATPDAVIRYTVDGSDPTAGGGTLYTGPVTITNSLRLSAAAFHSNLDASVVTYQEYEISGTVPVPLLYPGTGYYSDDLTVKISNLAFSALTHQVYYTTNGSDPALTNSASLYTEAAGINLPAGTTPVTLRAVAVDQVSGRFSPEVNAVYTFRSPTPSVQTGSALPGTYHTVTNVSLADVNIIDATKTVSYSLRYTLDGTLPDINTSADYSVSPIPINSNTTLLVQAFNTLRTIDGVNQPLLPASSVLTLQYRLQPYPPQILPNGGIFTGGINITLSNTNQGDTNSDQLRYTLYGEDPVQFGMAYGGSFSLSQDTLVKACISRPGWMDSEVVSKWYGFDYSDPGTGSMDPPVYISAFGFGGYGVPEIYAFGAQYNGYTVSWVEVTVFDTGALQKLGTWGVKCASSTGDLFDIGASNNWNWNFSGLTNGAVIRLTLHNNAAIWGETDPVTASPDRFDIYLPRGNLLDENYGVIYLESQGTVLHGIPYRFTAVAGSSWYGAGQPVYSVLQTLNDRGVWTGADYPYDIIGQSSSNVVMLAGVSVPRTGSHWMTVQMQAPSDTKFIETSSYTYGEVPADGSDNILQYWAQLTNLGSSETRTFSGEQVDGIVTAVFLFEEGVSAGCFALQDNSGAMLFYGITNIKAFSAGDRVTVSLQGGRRYFGCPFVDQYQIISIAPGGNPQLYYRSGAFRFPEAVGRLWRYDGAVNGDFDPVTGSAELDRWQMFLHTDSSNHAALPAGKSGTFFGVVTTRNGKYRLELPATNGYTLLSP